MLLSYPAIESFLLSCVQDGTFKQSAKLGRDAKAVLTGIICQEETDYIDLHLKTVDLVFSEDQEEAGQRLIHSINEMDAGLESVGVRTYDLDDLAPTLLKVYDEQQKKYIDDNTFSFISLVGMALLELGVIVECDENNDDSVQ